MSNLSRNGVAFLAMVVASAVLAGGCKDDPPANSGGGAPGGAAGGASGSAATGPDLSNPKCVAVAFAKAMQSNDMAAARAVSVGTDERYKTMEAMGEMMSGFKNYESAAVARFGDAGKTDAGRPDMVVETEASEVRTEGDTATLFDPRKPEVKHRMKLVKKDGKWKVDLGSMPMDEHTKKMAASAPKMKKLLDETAAEIKAGKYKTAQEAQQVLFLKMAAMMVQEE